MPDIPQWLAPVASGDPPLTVSTLALRLIVALVSGVCVA